MSSTTTRTPGNRLHLEYPDIGYFIGTQQDPVISVHVDDPDLSDRLRAIAGAAECSGGRLTVILPDFVVWKGHVQGSARTPSGFRRARDAASAALGLSAAAVILSLGRQGPDGRTPVAAVSRRDLRETVSFLRGHGIHPDHVRCSHDVPAFVEPTRLTALVQATTLRPAVPAGVLAALIATLAATFWIDGAENDAAPPMLAAPALQTTAGSDTGFAELAPLPRLPAAKTPATAQLNAPAPHPMARPADPGDIQPDPVQPKLARFTPEVPKGLPLVTVSTRSTPIGEDLGGDAAGWVPPAALPSPDLAQSILLKTTVSTLRRTEPDSGGDVRVAVVGSGPLPRPVDRSEIPAAPETPVQADLPAATASAATAIRPRKRAAAPTADLSGEITRAVAAANAAAPVPQVSTRPLHRQITVTAARDTTPPVVFKPTTNSIAVKPAAVLTPAPALKAPEPAPAPVQTRRIEERYGLERNKVSLVGLYGSSSHRRAILRLANGSMAKVRPGDVVNGERVAAVGTDSVRLTGGRHDTVLKLPK